MISGVFRGGGKGGYTPPEARFNDNEIAKDGVHSAFEDYIVDINDDIDDIQSVTDAGVSNEPEAVSTGQAEVLP